MNKYFDSNYLVSLIPSLWQRSVELITNTSSLLQTGIILVTLMAAYLVALPLRKWLQRGLGTQRWRNRVSGRLMNLLLPLIPFLLGVLLLRVGSETLTIYKLPTVLIDIAARLLTAWIIIRLSTAMLNDSHWSRLLSIIAWLIAALHILKLFIPVVGLLDQFAIDLGGIRISMLLLIKAVIILSVSLKLASSGSDLLEKRILSFEELTPSVQVLLSKTLKITLLTVAVIVALSSLGINLSAFAFLGGAIGVGVGFGLQKVVSNLVSGVILLLDRSIKPGDVIEIGSTYGRIQSLGARYVSVATRDKTEYLIPNDDLITTHVVNWSFSDKLVRLKIVVGVSYDADIHEVMRLMVASASNIPRVLTTPKPVCQLKNFGDSSIDMELRIWISDPENGISNVSSQVRVAIWDAFKSHNIEIPYPQRTLHILKQNRDPDSPN